MYKLKNCSTDNLIKQGFHEGYDGEWTLHFPVYFYKNYPTSFCDATIRPEESKRINLNVVRADGTLHYLWYSKAYVQAGPLLNKIDRMIHKKMIKIGAKYYED